MGCKSCTCTLPKEVKKPAPIKLVIEISKETAALLQRINPDATLEEIIQDYLQTADW